MHGKKTNYGPSSNHQSQQQGLDVESQLRAENARLKYMILHLGDLPERLKASLECEINRLNMQVFKLEHTVAVLRQELFDKYDEKEIDPTQLTQSNSQQGKLYSEQELQHELRAQLDAIRKASDVNVEELIKGKKKLESMVIDLQHKLYWKHSGLKKPQETSQTELARVTDELLYSIYERSGLYTEKYLYLKEKDHLQRLCKDLQIQIENLQWTNQAQLTELSNLRTKNDQQTFTLNKRQESYESLRQFDLENLYAASMDKPLAAVGGLLVKEYNVAEALGLCVPPTASNDNGVSTHGLPSYRAEQHTLLNVQNGSVMTEFDHS